MDELFLRVYLKKGYSLPNVIIIYSPSFQTNMNLFQIFGNICFALCVQDWPKTFFCSTCLMFCLLTDGFQQVVQNSHFIRLNWLPPFLCRYPDEVTPPGMVSRFWAPIALMGTGQETTVAAMFLKAGKAMLFSLILNYYLSIGKGWGVLFHDHHTAGGENIYTLIKNTLVTT